MIEHIKLNVEGYVRSNGNEAKWKKELKLDGFTPWKNKIKRNNSVNDFHLFDTEFKNSSTNKYTAIKNKNKLIKRYFLCDYVLERKISTAPLPL